MKYFKSLNLNKFPIPVHDRKFPHLGQISRDDEKSDASCLITLIKPVARSNIASIENWLMSQFAECSRILCDRISNRGLFHIRLRAM